MKRIKRTIKEEVPGELYILRCTFKLDNNEFIKLFNRDSDTLNELYKLAGVWMYYNGGAGAWFAHNPSIYLTKRGNLQLVQRAGYDI